MEATTTAVPDNAAAAVLAKILAMTFLGVSSFVAGSTPVCVFERLGIRRRARGAANAVLRLILNFGGGVLLCTTFLHLLPEVREGVKQLKDDRTIQSDAPIANLLAEFIMCTGFFIMFAIEELVHGFSGKSCHTHADQQHHSDYSHGHGQPKQRNDSNASGQSNPSYEKDEVIVTTTVTGRVANYNSCSSAVEMESVKKSAQPKNSIGTESIFRSFLVIGALSIHELFEGLAVGLEKNSKQVWSLTVAVACHKLVISFYIGLQMLSDRTKPLLAHCSILLFAVTSPTGIGIGALVSNLEETVSVVLFSVILQGLATGTLMYVVFFEVLKPSVEHLQVKQRILRLIFIALGFTSMLSIQLIITE